MTNEIKTYYLEMTSESQFRVKEGSNGLEVHECKIKQFQFNKFLYYFIGQNWQWFDKQTWTDEQWQAFAESDDLRTWVGYFKGSPAGYYELQKQNEGNVEIAYFGLASKFIGHGFGGYLLSHAIRSAWEWEGTKRVWVHTCTLDHPNALSNYESRGLSVYRVETEK